MIENITWTFRTEHKAVQRLPGQSWQKTRSGWAEEPGSSHRARLFL